MTSSSKPWGKTESMPSPNINIFSIERFIHKAREMKKLSKIVEPTSHHQGLEPRRAASFNQRNKFSNNTVNLEDDLDSLFSCLSDWRKQLPYSSSINFLLQLDDTIDKRIVSPSVSSLPKLLRRRVKLLGWLLLSLYNDEVIECWWWLSMESDIFSVQQRAFL